MTGLLIQQLFSVLTTIASKRRSMVCSFTAKPFCLNCRLLVDLSYNLRKPLLVQHWHYSLLARRAPIGRCLHSG